METTTVRRLGRSDIEVSAMGLGCWAIGGVAWRGETPIGWGVVDDEKSIRSTAPWTWAFAFLILPMFMGRDTLSGAGPALAGLRRRVVIATKFSNQFNEETKQAGGVGTSPEYIRSACENSLRRLNIERIDLYQFHQGGWALEEVPAILDTLEGLVREGKIRAYGWSTDDPARARAFAEGTHCTAVQLQSKRPRRQPGNGGLVRCPRSRLAGQGVLARRADARAPGRAAQPDAPRGRGDRVGRPALARRVGRPRRGRAPRCARSARSRCRCASRRGARRRMVSLWRCRAVDVAAAQLIVREAAGSSRSPPSTIRSARRSTSSRTRPSSPRA